MRYLSQPATKFWVVPQLDDLELFQARAIHYHYARHSHAGYAIGVIEAGVGGNYYQGSTYLAPPQSIVLMNPEEAHTGFSAEGLPLTYRMLYPSVSCMTAIANDQGSETPYFREAVIRDQELVNQVLSLHAALEQPQEQLAQQTLFVEAVTALLDRYGSKIRAVQGKEHRAVQQIKDYLHDNFKADISLAQLTALTTLNRSYLIRVFRQTVGMPPYTYLNQIRVEEAKQLLKQGMSIAETAVAVGMADQSHLNRHFKRIVGISPGQYRQMSTSFKTP